MSVAPNLEYAALVRRVETLRGEIVSLVLERDFLLFHRKPALESRYWTTVGLVESKTFELEVAVLRLRSKRALLQAALNREEKPDFAEVERQLDAELKSYRGRIDEEAKKIADAFSFGSAESLSNDDSQKLKKFYFEIVKRLHPDVAPQRTPEEKTTLNRAIDAYRRADLPTIQAIFYSLGATTSETVDPPSQNAFDELFSERDALEKSKATLLDSLEKMKGAFPFNVADFLGDADAVSRRLDELKAKQEDLQKTCRRFEMEIAEIEQRWSPRVPR